MKNQYQQGFPITQMPRLDLSKASDDLSKVKQPPQLRPHLREELDRLLRQAASSGSKSSSPRNTCRHELDYVEAISIWFNALAPTVRHRPYKLTEILVLAKLQGRYRDRPAMRVIGDTLRKLGWSEHRDWTRAGRNRRYWMPPKN